MIWRRIVPISYGAVVAFIRICLVLYVKGPTVIGKDNVPRKGGVIFVANHLNNADPCILPGVSPRRLNIMAKKEWFKLPPFALLFRLVGAFPVDRFGADRGALREAIAIVNRGEPLLMFPEGTRSKDRVLHQGFAGAALIAYKTGAPIVPIAITGTETIPWPTVFLRPFMGPRVTITFGKPFYPPPAERIASQQAKDATDDMMAHVAEMLPVQYRGFYAAAAAEREATRAREGVPEPV